MKLTAIIRLTVRVCQFPPQPDRRQALASFEQFRRLSWLERGWVTSVRGATFFWVGHYRRTTQDHRWLRGCHLNFLRLCFVFIWFRLFSTQLKIEIIFFKVSSCILYALATWEAKFRLPKIWPFVDCLLAKIGHFLGLFGEIFQNLSKIREKNQS